MRHVRILFLLTFLAAVAAACSGGGGGAGPVPGKPQHAGRAMVTLRMTIPSGTQTTSRRTGRREYVSQSVASIVYAIFVPGSTVSLVSGTDYVDIDASPAPCANQASPSSGTPSIVCSIAIPATIATAGTYTVAIGTYDAPQTQSCSPGGVPACAGNLLGVAELPETITPGTSTPLAITLGGVPAYFQPVGLLPGNVDGAGDSQIGLTIYGPQSETGQFELLDAQHNIIVDPGAPVASASPNPAVSIGVTESQGLYTATFKATTVSSGIGPVVQPGVYPITVGVTNPSLPAAAATNTFTVTVTVAHSALYAASCISGQCYHIYGYLDGNVTTPSFTLATSANFVTLATDASGDFYVGEGTDGSGVVTEYGPPVPGTSPSPMATIGVQTPLGVNVDQNGNVYVANCAAPCGGSGTNGVQIYAPGNFAAPMGVVALPSGAPGAAAVDVNGTLYTAPEQGSVVEQYLSPYGSSPNSTVTLPGSVTIGIGGIAIDAPAPSAAPSAAPGYWVVDDATGSAATAVQQISAGGTVLQNVASGLGYDGNGVAVDGNGDVYVAGSSTSGGTPGVIYTLTAPSYAIATLLAIPDGYGAEAVAVTPSANLLSGKNGGSPVSFAASAAHRRR